MKHEHRFFIRLSRRLMEAWRYLAPVLLAGTWPYRPPAPWEMELNARLLQRRQVRSAQVPTPRGGVHKPVGRVTCCAFAGSGV